MKRYFSHFSIILPSLFLKNQVIELDETNHLVSFYPFQEELQNTEFYSGLLVFAPFGEDVPELNRIKSLWEERKLAELESLLEKGEACCEEKTWEVYHFD